MTQKSTQDTAFPELNAAYNATFKPGKLSVGLVVPIEAYPNSSVPELDQHLERAQLADSLGFAALWLRDVPFNVPSFGDAGQTFDPFVYLGALSQTTQRIGLGVSSIILPLRHPAHVAKAAASADVLSNGRLLLGVASGDRPEEYPYTNQDYASRGERFRDSMAYIRAMADPFPALDADHGHLSGQADMLPKPTAKRLPLIITGGSQQAPEWVAEHGDGWMTYPRDPNSQGRVVDAYRSRIQAAGIDNKPVMQSLYIDLLPDADAHPRPIHLGFASGTRYLKEYLREIQNRGINHVALNLRFNKAGIEDTLKKLADELFSEFHS